MYSRYVQWENIFLKNEKLAHINIQMSIMAIRQTAFVFTLYAIYGEELKNFRINFPLEMRRKG